MPLRLTFAQSGRLLFVFMVVVRMCSCVSDNNKVRVVKKPTKVQRGLVTIKILPLGNVPNGLAQGIYNDLRKVYTNTDLLQTENMPAAAFYRPRNRYRADIIIQWLNKRAKRGEVFVGITTLDISTTNGRRADWGVMGLGYRPGNACVASDFRLKDNSNFFKVVIHELGHTAGLPHCAVATCFMRDAEGHDSTGEEKEFCKVCTQFLRQKGWKL